LARLARVIAPGVPHHVTQRANGRRFIFLTDAERGVYLELLRLSTVLHGVQVIGFCLMSNHVHIVAAPRGLASLALALKEAHGRFASYWNAANHCTGHLWQGRYYSCPLDEHHLWEALRYTELNPVRASLVTQAEEWPWSSAAVHCGFRSPDSWLDTEAWLRQWTSEAWKEFLDAGHTASCLDHIRRNTHTGRPLGSADFTSKLESKLQRHLAPRKPSPKKRVMTNNNEPVVPF
jgi:putative transposase